MDTGKANTSRLFSVDTGHLKLLLDDPAPRDKSGNLYGKTNVLQFRVRYKRENKCAIHALLKRFHKQPLDPTTHALLTWFQNEMLCDRRLNPCTLRPISKGADTRYRRHNARVLSWFYRVMACSEIQAPKYNEKNQSPLGRLEPGTLELRHEHFKARLHWAWSETHAV